MTSKEPMEPIDEEAGDLVDLEDVLESQHPHEYANEENLEQIANPEEPPLLDLLLD